MSSIQYNHHSQQYVQMSPMALPLPHQYQHVHAPPPHLQMLQPPQHQMLQPPQHQYYPPQPMPHPPPQQQRLIVDPRYSIHHHNNVVNINNISMHSLTPSPAPTHHYPQQTEPNIIINIPPPHKKRKLNNNTYINSTKEHEYKQQIRTLQQRLDESVSKNKNYEGELKAMKMLKEDVESMKMSRLNHIKAMKDQLNIINTKELEMTKLKSKLNQKDTVHINRLMDILKGKDEEIARLKSKYKEIKRVTAHLYLECVNGEEPRWERINVDKSQHGTVRDKDLAELHRNIRSLYRNGTCDICGIGQWRNNKRIEDTVKQFVELNGEYNYEPMVILKNTKVKRYKVIEKFKIRNNHRIKALNGQFGIRALMHIPSNTVCGQYFGAEISVDAFAQVFDGTAVEHDHNVYALDQEIDCKEIEKVLKKSKNVMDGDIERKCFVIDPFVVEEAELVEKLCLPFINDCRANINNRDPCRGDGDYYNVEFVGVKFNGWTQTYLITKRDIKKGEELMTYYGTVFGVAVKNKIQNEAAKQSKKIRIDREILQELKHEFQSTFRLCKHI